MVPGRRRRTITNSRRAEGAAATSVAAALWGQAGAGKIVCVISGGNINPNKIATILRGEIP